MYYTIEQTVELDLDDIWFNMSSDEQDTFIEDHFGDIPDEKMKDIVACNMTLEEIIEKYPNDEINEWLQNNVVGNTFIEGDLPKDKAGMIDLLATCFKNDIIGITQWNKEESKKIAIKAFIKAWKEIKNAKD